MADIIGTPGSTTYNANSSSERTYDLPAGVVAGELLLCIYAQDDVTAPSMSSAGWTLKRHKAASQHSLTVWAKIASGSEGSTVAIVPNDNEQASCLIVRVEAWSGDLDDVIVSAAASGSSANPDPDSVTAPWGALANLFIAVGSMDGNPTVSSYPSTYTDHNTPLQGGSSGCATLGLASAIVSGETSNPGTFTFSGSGDWAALTIVVRPEDTAPTTVDIVAHYYDGVDWIPMNFVLPS